MIKVSVIIVTYNEGLDVLKKCFDSVYSSKDISFELIVVDNGQKDSIRALLTSYQDATYLRNEENLGFAGAVNRGIKMAKGEVVLLLNPDAYFKEDVLEKMYNHITEDENVGIASCLIKYPDGSLQKSIRRFPTLKDQIMVLLKLPHFFKEIKSVNRYLMEDVDHYKTQEVDSIMGAFMLVKKNLINDIGLFDERYFIWFEEVDYCKMAKKAGWRVKYYTDVEIEHLKGHTFKKLAVIRKQKWFRMSSRKYIRKHIGFFSWLVLWLLAPLFILLAYISALISKK